MTALQRALAVIASPAVAGLLILLGLVGLYAELQNPGAIFPGVLGGICLLLGALRPLGPPDELGRASG